MLDLLHQGREINRFLLTDLHINHGLSCLSEHLTILKHVSWLNLSLCLHVEHFQNGVLEDRDARFLEDEN